MRARAQELGLPDAEVARRIGIAQPRYANYVADIRQPDFATFLRICSVLATTPNVLLGFDEAARVPKEANRLRERIVAAISMLSEQHLRTVLAVADSLPPGPSDGK